MAISAHDVAAALIQRQVAAGRTIDKLQLQKLLYLVQGVHAACWGSPAFRESIHAYRNGPVVQAVEGSYRTATASNPTAAPLRAPLGGQQERLPFETSDAVDTVLRYFGTWTGPALEEYTKRPGSPWRQVRAGLPASAASRVEMPLSAITKWFDEHGVDPNPSQEERWLATAEERRAADERIAAAQRLGVFQATVPDAFDTAVKQALATSAARQPPGAS